MARLPYLALYYVGQLGLVGYAFAVARTWGFVTLTTYLASTGATAHAQRREVA